MRTVVVLLVVVVVAVLFDWAHHHVKGECGVDRVVRSVKQWQRQRQLVKVSQKRFEELFREICPELLVIPGVPWKKVYADLLHQFDRQLIDEAFVRELLGQLKKRTTTYDGQNFYGFKDPSGKSSEPDKPIDPSVVAREKISVKFYLDNAEFYSSRIFRILTKQNKVKFAGEITEKGYSFEALQSMTQREFFTICADGKTDKPNARIRKGDRWWIPEKQLRQISRILSIAHRFRDHRGQQRQVTAHLDLKQYTTGFPTINLLPDGTVLSDGKSILQVGRKKLTVREVEGKLVEKGAVSQYVLKGKVLFEWRGRECNYNSYGPCSLTEEGSVFVEESTGRDILDVVVDRGSYSMETSAGKLFRKITPGRVEDSAGRVITNADDLGIKFQQQVLIGGRKMSAYPDLSAFVEVNPFTRKLAGDVAAPYSNRCERAQALLAFTQSFPYKEFMIPGGVKTPKDSYLSQEMDCEDASVKLVSLWTAAGFKAGFLWLRPKRGDKGHAAPLLAESSGCSGDGIPYGGQTWLYAEATGRGWRVGQYPGYNRKYWKHLFQPYGKVPVPLKR